MIIQEERVAHSLHGAIYRLQQPDQDLIILDPAVAQLLERTLWDMEIHYLKHTLYGSGSWSYIIPENADEFRRKWTAYVEYSPYRG